MRISSTEIGATHATAGHVKNGGGCSLLQGNWTRRGQWRLHIERDRSVFLAYLEGCIDTELIDLRDGDLPSRCRPKKIYGEVISHCRQGKACKQSADDRIDAIQICIHLPRGIRTKKLKIRRGQKADETAGEQRCFFSTYKGSGLQKSCSALGRLRVPTPDEIVGKLCSRLRDAVLVYSWVSLWDGQKTKKNRLAAASYGRSLRWPCTGT